MADMKRLSIWLEPMAGTRDRWSVPVSDWPGFHVLEVRSGTTGPLSPFSLEGDVIACQVTDPDRRAVALIEVESPATNIEAAQLALDQAKAKTEDIWRSRTYLFSIGSALLTAVVTITVALITRPSHDGVSFDVDAVRSCRDNFHVLSMLPEIKDQNVANLSTAIRNHVNTCEPVLQGLLDAASKKDGK